MGDMQKVEFLKSISTFPHYKHIYKWKTFISFNLKSKDRDLKIDERRNWKVYQNRDGEKERLWYEGFKGNNEA